MIIGGAASIAVSPGALGQLLMAGIGKVLLMIEKAIDDPSAAGSHILAEGFGILLAGSPTPAAARATFVITPPAQLLLEFVVTGIGNVLLMVKQAFRSRLGVTPVLWTEALHVGTAWASAFLGRRGQRREAGQSQNEDRLKFHDFP
jgi:hypothetical protein